MPFFKSTYNILVDPTKDEVFNENWLNFDSAFLPPSYPWDYKKEMSVEDVDIWEVIYEAGGGVGIYAAWCPYAEFYLVTYGTDSRYSKIIDGKNVQNKLWETYYGQKSQEKIKKLVEKYNIPVVYNKIWVEPEDMWLYI